MADIKPAPDQELGLPDDLHEWTASGSLLRLILDALDTVEREIQAAHHRPQLPAGESRLLLTVLVYSYAIGLYPSDEISRELLVNEELAYISAKAAFSAERLRHFRRHQRGVLERTLTCLLQTVWHLHHEPESEGAEVDEMLFVWAAETRINRAVLADTMALDL